MRDAAVLALALAACAPSTVREAAPRVPTTGPATDDATRPESSFEALRAALPEPNAEAAFVLDADVVYGGGIPDGRLRIAAEAGEFGGKSAWFVAEDTETPAFPGPGTPASSSHRTLWLSRDLHVLASNTVTTSEGATVTATATRDDFPLAAALLFFRMCPAEATARGDEALTSSAAIWKIDADGTLHCGARAESVDAHITMQGPGRVPVRVEQFIGWHDMGTIVARETPPK